METPIDEPGDDRRNVAALWELAGLKESAPAAEKGFSMLTAALKKKMDVQRAHDKKVAAAVARKTAGNGGTVGTKVIPIATRFVQKTPVAAKKNSLKKVGRAKKSGGAKKKVSGAKRKRG